MSRKQRLTRVEQHLTRVGQTSLGLASLVAAELPAGHLVSGPEGPGLASLLPPAIQSRLASEEPFARNLDAYQILRDHWRNDPVRYAVERLGLQATWQQQQILEALIPEGAKVTVRSGHGIGKSGVAAAAVWWFLETRNFARVPCTAPASHQLKDILWGELAKWLRKADGLSRQRGDHPRVWLSSLFRLTKDRLYDRGAPDEWFAAARTSGKDNPEALQGFHSGDFTVSDDGHGVTQQASGAILFVIEEASGVYEPVFEVAEGALSSRGARVLMLGNPTRNTGSFASSHRQNRAEYRAFHFRSQDSPLVDPDYRPRLVRKFGEGSNVVRVRADGEFPRQDDDTLIAIELTEAALQRERPLLVTGARRLGIDVARFGDDRTVLLLRQGPVVERIAIHAKQDTMATVGHVLQAVQAWAVEDICVDVIGVGAGVYDRLAELQREGKLSATVHAANVAEAAPTRHADQDAQGRSLRDYLWLLTAAWLREGSPVFAADREHCEDLAGELSSVKYAPDSSGRLVIESKDRMKARGLRSPDLADALTLTFFTPSRPRWRFAPVGT
jgi:phage terminase large subunit